MKDILLQDLQSIADSDTPFESFREKTILITGATGLIGSLMVKSLLFCNKKKNLGLRVLALIRNEQKAREIYEEFLPDQALEFVKGDLIEGTIDFEGDCDFILHAAAITTSKIMVSNPVETILTAVNGTEKILKLAVEKNARSVVYVSSMEVYGQPSAKGKTKETDLGYVDLTNVRSCYPEGKRMCECLCTAYASQYHMNVCVARLAQTFGAGILPGENRVFAQFARSAMNGKDIILHTTGESEGNYVYTADAVRGLLLLLVKGEPGQAYNVVNSDTHTTIRGMAEMVAGEIADHKIKVIIDIPEDSKSLGYAPPVRMWLDGEKLEKLGWHPTVSLKEAYLRTMEWM